MSAEFAGIEVKELEQIALVGALHHDGQILFGHAGAESVPVIHALADVVEVHHTAIVLIVGVDPGFVVHHLDQFILQVFQPDEGEPCGNGFGAFRSGDGL